MKHLPPKQTCSKAFIGGIKMNSALSHAELTGAMGQILALTSWKHTALAWQFSVAGQMLAWQCTGLIWKHALNTSHWWDQGEATSVSLWADSECRCREPGWSLSERKGQPCKEHGTIVCESYVLKLDGHPIGTPGFGYGVELATTLTKHTNRLIKLYKSNPIIAFCPGGLCASRGMTVKNGNAFLKR